MSEQAADEPLPVAQADDDEVKPPAHPSAARGSGGTMALLAILPLVLLAALVAVFVSYGDELLGPAPVPADALGRLEIERILFRPEGIGVQLVNSGPAPLTVAQVIVNDAIWEFGRVVQSAPNSGHGPAAAPAYSAPVKERWYARTT